MSGEKRKNKNLMPKIKVILDIMTEAFDHFDTTSIFYSQETWLKQIKRKSGRDIKRRQLNYDFAAMCKMGILKRYSRHRKHETRGYEFRSTRCYLDATGWKMAAVWKAIPWEMAHLMIGAIKKGAQAKINKVKEWVTPDWLTDFYEDIEPKTPVPDD